MACGQLEFEHAEHREGKHRKKHRERHQHPRRLQARLKIELCAEHPHQRPEQGETGGHRQDVSKRQIEAAQPADLTAQHHAGKDGQHRQHARGEGQTQAGEKEQGELTPAPALRRGWRRCTDAINAQAFGLGRITQAFVGAALIGHGQREGARIGARHFDVENAVINLDVAKVFIVLLFALGQLRRAKANLGWIGAKLKAMAIEVVTLCRDKTQLDRLRCAFYQAQLKRLAHRQEVGAVVDRAQGGTGSTLQQPGGGGRQGEH